MSRIHDIVTAALGLLGSAAQAHGPLYSVLPPQRADLSDYRWEARPVLIFAPDPEHPDFKDQVAELREARAGLVDRDMVVLVDTDPFSRGRLRSALAVDGFEILLVGKDGSVKLREDRPLTARSLFETIDRMPMRRREMQTPPPDTRGTPGADLR